MRWSCQPQILVKSSTVYQCYPNYSMSIAITVISRQKLFQLHHVNSHCIYSMSGGIPATQCQQLSQLESKKFTCCLILPSSFALLVLDLLSFSAGPIPFSHYGDDQEKLSETKTIITGPRTKIITRLGLQCQTPLSFSPLSLLALIMCENYVMMYVHFT